jgi:hypothetical protein
VGHWVGEVTGGPDPRDVGRAVGFCSHVFAEYYPAHFHRHGVDSELVEQVGPEVKAGCPHHRITVDRLPVLEECPVA